MSLTKITKAVLGILFSTQAQAETGTDDNTLMTPLKSKQAFDNHHSNAPHDLGKFESQMIHARDEKSSGTNGGTFTSGDWRQRDLNTTPTNEISGASVSTNHIVLPAGTYYIEASAGALGVNSHQAMLYDATGAAVLIMGTNERSNNAYQSSQRSTIAGRFTLSVTSSLAIMHRGQTTVNNTGFGIANSFGYNEVYTDARIWKLD